MGRPQRGQPAFRVVNARQSSHVSTIFAVSNERGLIHHAFKGGYRSADFKQFLEECSERFQDMPLIFIFDNAPCHNVAATVQLKVGHSYHFKPAYSPFLNICEGSFSLWKAEFKRLMAETRDDLLQQQQQQRVASMMQLAEQAIAAITIEKVHNIYQHMLTLLPACMAGEDINHE